MRFARTIALVGVGLLWLALGPVALLLALLSLSFSRVRAWLRPTRRVVVGWVAATLVLAGSAVVVPDGWAPIAPGAGALVTPAYVGRPARPQPVGVRPEPNPHLAANAFRGPLGESPRVTTKSYGVDGCRQISVDTHGRLVTLCGGAGEPVLRLVDPESLRQRADKELPGREGCPAVLYVDDHDRAVVATAQRRLLLITTADAEGDPDLTTVATVDLDGHLPDDDCVTGLAPDWRGRPWFASRDGRVGVVDGDRVRGLDLADSLDRPLTAAADGVYVAGGDALYKLTERHGRPVVVWRSTYDGGERGSAPALLTNGLVAVADDRDPRLRVVFHRQDTGEVVCRQEVFDDDESATDGGLVPAGAGVVVLNGHGYGGPLSTALGRTTTGGIARVDVDRGECTVTWESDLDAPSGAPAVSLATGLAYAYTKRHSWLGADGWYLTALDLRTGRATWAVRTGLGPLRDNHHGDVALGPDGSAYVPVLGGLVRVHDRD